MALRPAPLSARRRLRAACTAFTLAALAGCSSDASGGTTATATLAVTFAGLPGGVNGSATVSAAGYSRSISGSQSITDLPLIAVTVTADNITAGGTVYIPDAPTQSVTLTRGNLVSVTVTYHAQSPPAAGEVDLSVNGLPPGVAAAVTVTGPDNVAHAATGSAALTGLAAGSYTISVANVLSEGFTYSPVGVPATVTVVGGSSTPLTITYAAVDGGLALTLSGLPAGSGDPVTIAGPGGFTRTFRASEAVTGLAPGSYTITALVVTVGANSYAPEAASQSVAVTAGGTAAVTVGYAIMQSPSGSLIVTISGLPVGVNANVNVSSATGPTQPITATTMLANLASGNYTVTAQAVASGTTTWVPGVVTQPVAVAPGATAIATVTYSVAAPVTGALTVTISGLPAGANANVLVTSSPDYSQGVTATRTLGTLAPAIYAVAAQAVSTGGVTYIPAPAAQNIAVTAGATAAATVTYSATTVGNYLPISPGFHTRTMVVDGVTRGYQLYIPPGYDPAVPQRVILFLNGSGENGSNNTSQVTVGLGKYISDNSNTFPDVVVFPQTPSGFGDDATGSQSVYHVQKMALDLTVAEVHTDLARVCVTGISSGGSFAWMMAYHEPNRYAAVAPIAAFILGPRVTFDDATSNADAEALAIARLGTIPIHTYVGALDNSALVASATQDAIAFATDPNFLLTIIAGAGHGGSWDQTYASPAFWSWLRAQHR